MNKPRIFSYPQVPSTTKKTHAKNANDMCHATKDIINILKSITAGV